MNKDKEYICFDGDFNAVIMGGVTLHCPGFAYISKELKVCKSIDGKSIVIGPDDVEVRFEDGDYWITRR